MHNIPRSEHPRPDFMRSPWVNLNGEWQFAFDDGDLGRREAWHLPDKQLSRTITVPFCYQSERSGINLQDKHEILWYRRKFALPDEMLQKRVLLRFGAVDYFCEVYVNGTRVGEHRGGYTPFALDITHCVQEGENDICLRVEDRFDCTQPRGKQNWLDKRFGCWYTPSSGIWQTVYLEAVGSPYLTKVHVTPDIDQGVASVRLTLHERPKTPIKAELVVSLQGQVYRCVSQTLQERSQRVIIDMVRGEDIQGFRMWSPESPTLYDLTVKLDSGDEVSTYFGMRSVEVKDGYVLLNKRPVYQRLILDQGYWPESILTPPSDEAIRADIEWTQRFGYNGARKHQKIEDPRYYYWADRMGILVWGEVPSTYEFTDESVNNLSETMAGFIERDFNHPCIIAWVPLNESWGVDRIYKDKRMQAAGCMLYHQAKALDGTRIVSSNDGWEQVTTDIYALHDYAAWGNVLAAHFADREVIDKSSNDHHMSWAAGYAPTGREALILTEYGGIGMATGEAEADAWGYHGTVHDTQALLKRYESVTEAARAIPNCQGYCYTQLTDVEQEINGLLTVDRKPKANPELIARLTKNPDRLAMDAAEE